MAVEVGLWVQGPGPGYPIELTRFCKARKTRPRHSLHSNIGPCFPHVTLPTICHFLSVPAPWRIQLLLYSKTSSLQGVREPQARTSKGEQHSLKRALLCSTSSARELHASYLSPTCRSHTRNNRSPTRKEGPSGQHAPRSPRRLAQAPRSPDYATTARTLRRSRTSQARTMKLAQRQSGALTLALRSVSSSIES